MIEAYGNVMYYNGNRWRKWSNRPVDFSEFASQSKEIIERHKKSWMASARENKVCGIWLCASTQCLDVSRPQCEGCELFYCDIHIRDHDCAKVQEENPSVLNYHRGPCPGKNPTVSPPAETVANPKFLLFSGFKNSPMVGWAGFVAAFAQENHDRALASATETVCFNRGDWAEVISVERQYPIFRVWKSRSGMVETWSSENNG